MIWSLRQAISRDPRLLRARFAAQTRRLSAVNICLGLSILLAAVAAPQAATQQLHAVAPPPVADIVQQLVARNQERARLLGPYTSLREYHLQYIGFPHAAEAALVVDVTCESNTSIQFHVISESGSHFLANRILKRLLKAEQDADRERGDNGLTPANYNFTLERTETDKGRKLYVLQVDPWHAKALLYRGTIWVDAQDYAVVKIDAEPARSPSFWIRNTEIHHTYQKIGDFWLPQQDRSQTRVRLGGSALLTIKYQQYRLSSAALPSPDATNQASADLSPSH
ncbi:MAG TPA: hypothetical protein VMD97_13130 [Candidatus Aquilonibacter sp.]|nr:hypothetical protein [Candidatus Aquilonibacter sp.]